MIEKATILSILESYRRQFPEEETTVRHFLDFVIRFDDADLQSRKNFTGHLTTGGIIVSRQSGRVLLLKHNQLKKWLQPGGHIELEDATPVDAARREILEETGIGGGCLRLLSFSVGAACPVDIDCHYIGACAAKREAEHYHYDLRFAFIFDADDDEVLIDRQESGGFKWLGMREFAAIDEFERVAPKIIRLLDEVAD